MKIIELSPECRRFDSIVTANEKGDIEALRAALQANIGTPNKIMNNASETWIRYQKTLLALMADLNSLAGGDK
jgi:hypothetical protein